MLPVYIWAYVHLEGCYVQDLSSRFLAVLNPKLLSLLFSSRKEQLLSTANKALCLNLIPLRLTEIVKGRR